MKTAPTFWPGPLESCLNSPSKNSEAMNLKYTLCVLHMTINEKCSIEDAKNALLEADKYSLKKMRNVVFKIKKYMC